MKVFVDSNDGYKCHVTEAEGLIPVEAECFDGMCQAYIEGCRCVPEGYEWQREDGKIFVGFMVCPWLPYAELEKAQAAFELEQAKSLTAEYEAALCEIETALGVTV